MIQDIVNGLINRIYEEFNCEVYFDKILQGVIFPCFYIVLLDSKETRLIDFRYKVESTFLIQYITDINKSLNYNLYEVLEKMNNITDILTLENGDKLLGLERSSEIIDNNLKIKVKYKYINYRAREKYNDMEKLQYSGGVKTYE